jgi:type I restriction enzyme R subunit
LDIISNDLELRSKRELIEKFINSTIPKLEDGDQVQSAFDSFMDTERRQAFEELCRQEGIDSQKLEDLINRYLFTGRMPRQDDYANSLMQQPKILERQSIIDRVASRFSQFVETFIEGT